MDPSGHFAISATLVAIFAMAALNAGFEMFNRKVVQKREKMNWWLVGFEAAIGGIMGYGGAAMAGMMATGAGTMLGTQSAKQVTAGVLKNALFAGSYAAIDNMAHQTLDGRKLREVDYGSVVQSAEVAAGLSLVFSVIGGSVQNMRLRKAQKARKGQAGKITEYAGWKNPYRVDENELITGGNKSINSSELVFVSTTKSTQKLTNQMKSRGWTEDLIKNTVDNPYTVRSSVNKATGNTATVFYTRQGSYVIVDDITKAIVQISDNINPSMWAPDISIVDPYLP